jgi:hypothetical protein
VPDSEVLDHGREQDQRQFAESHAGMLFSLCQSWRYRDVSSLQVAVLRQGNIAIEVEELCGLL